MVREQWWCGGQIVVMRAVAVWWSESSGSVLVPEVVKLLLKGIWKQILIFVCEVFEESNRIVRRSEVQLVAFTRHQDYLIELMKCLQQTVDCLTLSHTHMRLREQIRESA